MTDSMALMTKPLSHFHLLFLFIFLSIHRSTQLLPSQFHTLLQIQQLLNYPPSLSIFNNSTDFCNIEPTQSLTLVCYEDSLTQLHINGYNGFPPLHPNFSSTGFFSTLVNLPSLKVLSLVSMGLWGPLPPSIDQLISLEILNVSSNYFNGFIPVQISSLKNLQSLVLDQNEFTGKVPGWLSSLPLLSVLSLKNNSFNGFLPNSIGTMQSLRVLTLSMNRLSGAVPNLGNLTNLQILDLEDNLLGPHFPNLPTKLLTLVLRNNSFRFGISSDLNFYYRLQKLDISLNGFVGPFLSSLLSLPSINYLDIGGNKFTGKLFMNMSCNDDLAFVNLSSNLLTGDLPTCLKVGSKDRVVLYARNCLSNGDQEQHPSNYCHNEALAVGIVPHRREQKSPHVTPIVSLGIIGGTGVGVLVLAVIFLVVRRANSKDSGKEPSTRYIMENVSTLNTTKLLYDAKYISQTMKLGASLPSYRTFSLEELKEATNNFDASASLAEGSHGQIYKGKLTDGSIVAIRTYKIGRRNSLQSYRNHLELISKLRHSHLISSLGHCLESHPDDSTVSKIFLVFEYVPCGTLRSSISGQKLSWVQRIAAAIEVVKGIQFLHTGIMPGIYSNNLKITDILLDQNLHVKISSYNLPLLAEYKGTMGAGVSSLVLKGNRQERAKHEDKNDVYDIGVILLEIILGRPIMFQNEVGVLKDLVQVSIATDDIARRSIVDPGVHKECSDESLKTMMEICLRCLSKEPADRPSVEDILWNLQFAAQIHEAGRGSNTLNSRDSPVSSPRDI